MHLGLPKGSPTKDSPTAPNRNIFLRDRPVLAGRAPTGADSYHTPIRGEIEHAGRHWLAAQAIASDPGEV